MNDFRDAKQVLVAAGFLFASVLLTGCSDSVPTGRVSGKVTYKDKVVEGGTITFVPDVPGAMPGKPAAGTIGSDGTYKLSTYGANDGAVIGKHKIRFSPAAVPFVPKELKKGESQTPGLAPASPYAGLISKQDNVEVTAGSNTVNIELVEAVK